MRVNRLMLQLSVHHLEGGPYWYAVAGAASSCRCCCCLELVGCVALELSLLVTVLFHLLMVVSQRGCMQ
jgi:hypothetical protein